VIGTMPDFPFYSFARSNNWAKEQKKLNNKLFFTSVSLLGWLF